MPFDEHPAVAAMFPAMGNPDSAWMRRTYPMAVYPHVSMAVPAVIAVDPHPARMQRMIVDLDNRRRGRDSNYNSNLRKRGRRSQTESEQQ